MAAGVPTKHHEQRTAILRAANRVMRKRGLHHTTISAVAEEADMSKGGVLYYFRNKQELLEGTIKRYEELASARFQEIVATLPDEPGRLLRATVLAMLELMEEPAEDMHSGIGFIGDDTYQKVIGLMKKHMYDGLCEIVPDKEKLTALLLIIDGMWTNKMFSFYDDLQHLKPQVVDIIMEMVDECSRA